MQNFDFSLIFPDAESQRNSIKSEYRPNISREVTEQLELSELLELKNSDLSDYFTTDPAVIEYRLQNFEDMLENPEIGQILVSVMPILSDVLELRRLDTEAGATTESYLYSISEIELYISCIERLSSGFSKIKGKIKSNAFKFFAERIEELSQSDYYKELNQKLTELTSRVRDIKSITVGVNLDAQLRPADAGVLAVNSQYFKSGDIIDKILRLNFKEDEYTCIAPLVPFVRGQSENLKMAQSFAFNSAINDVFKSSVRSWKKIVQFYVLENTDFLLRIMPEIEFMVKGTELMRKLREAGCSLARPQVMPMDDKAFDLRGIYNPSVALKIDDEIVENDITFDEMGGIYVLTGPNRGGKSVVTCAVGIAQAMVQLGMYAPAESAVISPADAIFTHFPGGSEDTIDKGRLGEECARLGHIFDQVTKYSLVLLDESLSSTGAYEGAYIASEVLLGFAKVGCRALFSTHLHELAASLDSINEQSARYGGVRIDSLVAGIEAGKRSFKIMRAIPDGKSYARDIAVKYGLSGECIEDKIRARAHGVATGIATGEAAGSSEANKG